MFKFISSVLLLLVGISCFSQQSTTVKVPPSKDTTVVKFVTNTVTSANTTTTYTTSTIPVNGGDTVVPVPPPVGYELILQNNYDTDADLDPNGNQQYGKGFIDKAFKLTGAGSFRSIPQNVSSGYRSEVQYSNVPPEGAFEYDVNYHYVEPNGCHSTQIHPNSSSGSAIIALWHNNSSFDVCTNDGSTNTHQSGTLMKIQTEKWYHMRCEYKLGSGAYVKWYIDNILYFTSKAGVKIPSSGYFKHGFNGNFYGSSTWQNSNISFDNLKIYRKL